MSVDGVPTLSEKQLCPYRNFVLDTGQKRFLTFRNSRKVVTETL
jgi:hypothetical protein